MERFYGMMKKNAMFMIKNAGPKDRKTLAGDPDQKYIYEKGMHLGEWLEPEEFQEKISAGNMPEHPEECTAYLHYTWESWRRSPTFWERKMTRLSLPSIPRGQSGRIGNCSSGRARIRTVRRSWCGSGPGTV